MDTLSPYAVLGVSPTASAEEIKAAYRRLVLMFHPDRNQGFKQEADQKFKEIQTAYDILSDDGRRHEWDAAAEDREQERVAQAKRDHQAHRAPGPTPATEQSPRSTNDTAQSSVRQVKGRFRTIVGMMLSAAALDAALIRERWRLTATTRLADQVAAECGRFAIDNATAANTTGLSELNMLGVRLLAQIRTGEADIRVANDTIRRPNGQTNANQARDLRQKISSLKREVMADKLQLVQLCKELGKQILSTENNPQFEVFRLRATVAGAAVGGSRRKVASLEQQRRELDPNLPVGPRAAAGVLFAVGAIIVGLVAVKFSGASSSNSAESTRIPSGLTQSDLRLASPTIVLQWTTWRDGNNGGTYKAVPDATGGCQGSSSVIKIDGPKLYLLTNKHCLDLPAIIATKTSDFRVTRYDILVKFPSGQSRPATKFAYPQQNIDLAKLEIDGQGLEAGKDFVVLSPYSLAIQEGDEVAAVGSPLGFDGSQTFGRVSALREDDTKCRFIQTDAAINHGNSGGPLFLRKGDRFQWIGINTLIGSPTEGSVGINFAIDAKHVSSTQFSWYDSSSGGAATCIWDMYQVNAGTH